MKKENEKEIKTDYGQNKTMARSWGDESYTGSGTGNVGDRGDPCMAKRDAETRQDIKKN